MLYSPKSIANYFLDLAKSSGEAISPMKLQKLVYYAHGWYAGHTGNPLINEAIEAWQYGPVIPSLYHEFKAFGSGQIFGKARNFDGITLSEVNPPVDAALRQFLNNIWSNYSQFTGLRLSEMTHAPDGPWDRAWKISRGMHGVDIPFDSIAEHFREAIENAKLRTAQN
jgi:uncharacterized phage-associated protein